MVLWGGEAASRRLPPNPGRPRPRPQDHLLEVGSGGGTFLAWALATGCTAMPSNTAARRSPWPLGRNASEIAAGRLDLQQADAAHLPFLDEEFTAAATMNAFFFSTTPERCWRRFTGPSHQRGVGDRYGGDRAATLRPSHAPLHRPGTGGHARSHRLRARRAAPHGTGGRINGYRRETRRAPDSLDSAARGAGDTAPPGTQITERVTRPASGKLHPRGVGGTR